MRYKRILFCIPPQKEFKPIRPHSGIGYLSAFLSENNIENDVIDMTRGYSLEHLQRKIRSFKPDIVGFSLVTQGYPDAYNLIAKVREENIPVVVGGPHASVFRVKVLEDSRADFVVKLEGEHTLLELMNGRELSQIKGLIYREGESIIENDDRPFIQDLDSLPIPTFDKFEINKYPEKSIPIITSRGCPYSCIYCPVSLSIGRQLRMRSPENILEEMKYWYERGYRRFVFHDDNFTFDKERVIRLCDLIVKEGFGDLILDCPNGIRADKVDEELLTHMKDAGFSLIAFGVEAANNKVLKRLRKAEPIEVIEQSIALACDMGFNVTLFFLLGSPEEEEADVEESFRLALKYPVNEVCFYNIIPYPGTELYDWLEQNDYFIKDQNEYLKSESAHYVDPVFITPQLSRELRWQLLMRGKKISREVRRKSIKRRLQGSGVPGFMGHFIGMLLASDFADSHILENRYFRTAYNAYLHQRSRG